MHPYRSIPQTTSQFFACQDGNVYAVTQLFSIVAVFIHSDKVYHVLVHSCNQFKPYYCVSVKMSVYNIVHTIPTTSVNASKHKCTRVHVDFTIDVRLLVQLGDA